MMRSIDVKVEDTLRAIAHGDLPRALEICVDAAVELGGGAESIDLLSGIADWLDDAEDYLSAAKARIEVLRHASVGDPDPAIVIEQIEALACECVRLGQVAAALDLLQIGLELCCTAEGKFSGRHLNFLDQYAQVLEDNGRIADALLVRERAKSLKLEAQSAIELERGEVGPSMPIDRRQKSFDINIHYATHRNPEKGSNPYRRYGGQRNAVLNYGVAQVSVPINRRPGEFRAPPLFSRNGYTQSDRYFMLRDVQPVRERSTWLEELRGVVGASRGKEIVVYIHGYNQSFWRAILRAAQLHVDLLVDGVTVAYSWPSRGSLLFYDTDRSGIGAVADDLKNLIAELASPFSLHSQQVATKPRLIIVAHSMGCDYMLRALEKFRIDAEGGRLWQGEPPISDIIFGSPTFQVGSLRSSLPATM